MRGLWLVLHRGGAAALAATAVAITLASCSNAGPGFCGDALCRPSESESCSTCAADCGGCAGCGDGTCDTSAGESCASCVADCGACAPSCGNGACDGAETCSSCPGDCGACMTACGPTTCAGCCASGVCETGTGGAACGLGGGGCMVCGPGLICSGGGCVVDPASRWNIVLESLTVSSTAFAGSAWDALGGAPDPVVDVRVGSETSPARRQNGPDNVFAITYDGSAIMSDVRASDLQAFLLFEVYDEDVTDYEFIGACIVGVPDAAFAGATQTVDCPVEPSTRNSGFVLRWHLEQF